MQTKRNYPEEAFSMIYKLEPKHFWFVGRNKIISSFIKSNIKKPTGLRFLDVGCGTGYILSSIEKLGFEVVGLDLDSEAIKYSRKRTKAILVAGDLGKINFDKKFDAIGIFDVLEHIDNQDKFLNDCKKKLKEKGMIFVTVPAFMDLWTRFDDVSGHKRRYTKKELIMVLSRNGLKVKKTNYFGFLYFLPQLISRKFLSRKFSSKNDWQVIKESLKPPPFPLNSFLGLCMWIESKIITTFNLPFGGSIIVCACKE